MKRLWANRKVLVAALVAMCPHPGVVWGCSACYGQSDSPMAHGLNWGIFSLLLVVASMLGGIASFFVYLARRSASLAASANQSPTIHH